MAGRRDRLTWDNTAGAVVGRYVNWELFELTNGSELTFSSTLTLGDFRTGNGTLSIDPTSTVFAGNGDHRIVPFTGGRACQGQQCGNHRPDERPRATATDVADDRRQLSSASADACRWTPISAQRLTVRQARHQRCPVTCTGRDVAWHQQRRRPRRPDTRRRHPGGRGHQRRQDAERRIRPLGIVAAGPYEYLLYRGGYSAGIGKQLLSPQCRGPSAIPPAPTQVPIRTLPPPGPQPQPPIPDPDPGPNPHRDRARSAAPGPRPVAGTFTPADHLLPPRGHRLSALPGAARLVGLETLGTFHERRGDQGLLPGRVRFPRCGVGPSVRGRSSAATGRWRRSSTGTSSASRPASTCSAGTGTGIVTASACLSAMPRPMPTSEALPSGHAGHRAAPFRLMRRASACPGSDIGPQGWYVDAILMQSWLDGDPRSYRGIGLSSEGTAHTRVAGGRLPLPLGSTISFSSRRPSSYGSASTSMPPRDPVLDRHLEHRRRGDRADRRTPQGHVRNRLRDQSSRTSRPILWDTFSGSDATRFATVTLPTRFEFDLARGRRRCSATRVTEQVSLYARRQHETDLGGNRS